MPPARKYKTAEQMQKVIDTWAENLEESKKPPTLTGLALALGFCSRQSIYDYEEREEFTFTIKRAKLIVEQWYESLLSGTTPTGAIFALKNFGWRDDRNWNIGGQEDNPINITVTVKNEKR